MIKMKNYALIKAAKKVVEDMITWAYEFADIDSMYMYVREYYNGSFTTEELDETLLEAGLIKYENIHGTTCYAKYYVTEDQIIKVLDYEEGNE